MSAPINAEPPAHLLIDSWITPVGLWFARNHHPVPDLQGVEPSKLQIQIQPTSTSTSITSSSITIDLLKSSFPVHSVVATIQCGGNRRGEMSQLARTNGTSWDQGAISNAKWTGVRLRDVLQRLAGIDEDSIDRLNDSNLHPDPTQHIRHVHFISHDGETVIYLSIYLFIYSFVYLLDSTMTMRAFDVYPFV